MFKIQPNPTFEVPVQVHVPGVSNPDPMVLLYRHHPKDKLEEISKRVDQAKEITVETILELVAGWKDVDAEFSREQLVLLEQNYPSAFPQIYGKYWDSLKPARLGN